MSEEETKLAQQLKKLNSKLDEFGNKNKFMIYSAKPFKFAWANFMAGTFFSLGRLFGSIFIFSIMIYFLSKMNLGGFFSNWMENTISQINWEKVIPQPKMQLDLNDLNLDQFNQKNLNY
ncbi:hypothetical protein KKE45_00685 [Patescibacteria group bacterium]|nr:hypothetical protein [Patescibacteria group bacterium]